jgi:hypothetical protein
MPKRGPLRGTPKKKGAVSARNGGGDSAKQSPFSVKWDDEELVSEDSDEEQQQVKKKGKILSDPESDYEELDADQKRKQ